MLLDGDTESVHEWQGLKRRAGATRRDAGAAASGDRTRRRSLVLLRLAWRFSAGWCTELLWSCRHPRNRLGVGRCTPPVSQPPHSTTRSPRFTGSLAAAFCDFNRKGSTVSLSSRNAANAVHPSTSTTPFVCLSPHSNNLASPEARLSQWHSDLARPFSALRQSSLPIQVQPALPGTLALLRGVQHHAS